MSVRTAHAKDVNELGKYDFIYSLSYFSIAENVIEDKTLVLKEFKHSHEEYEFLIPLTTIPLLYYHKANYIGEVGFIYPVNPYVEHGLEVDLHSRVISITVSFELIISNISFLFFSKFESIFILIVTSSHTYLKAKL